MSTNAAEYRITLLTESEYALWDDFVSRSKNGTLFHTTQWAGIVQSVFGRSFKILAVFKKDQIAAGMLFWPRTVAGKWWLSQAPVTPYQGLVLRQPEAQKLSTRLADEARLASLTASYLKSRLLFMDISFSPLVKDLRPFLWEDFEVQPQYTYRFKITDPAEVQAHFSQALRRKLKSYQLQKEKIAPGADAKILTEFIAESYRFHGTKPPVPAAQLERLFHLILERQMGRLFYLHREGKPVAGLLALHDHRHVFTYFAGIHPDGRRETHTEPLYFHLLHQPEYRGKIFDFLGADLPDFDQFKRSFGGNLELYFRVRYTKNIFVKMAGALRRSFYMASRSANGDRG